MKLKFLSVALVLFFYATSIFAQSNNSSIFLMGAQYLLSKTKVDPIVIKIIENALPKAINQDVEGTVYEFTKVIFEKKNIKVLNPDYAVYLTNKTESLVKSIRKNDYPEIMMALSDIIVVTDNYVSRNVVPDRSYLNTNKMAKTLVDSTQINKSLTPVEFNQDKFVEEIKQINAKEKKISCIAFTPFGGYIILYGKNGFISHHIPRNASNSLDELNAANKTIKSISFSPTGGYVILYGSKGYMARGVGTNVLNELSNLNHNNNVDRIDQVSFSPQGGVVIVHDKYSYSSINIPTKLDAKLTAIQEKQYTIEDIAFSNNGGFTVNFGKNGYSTAGTSSMIAEKLKEIHDSHSTINFVSFLLGGGCVIVYDDNAVTMFQQ